MSHESYTPFCGCVQIKGNAFINFKRAWLCPRPHPDPRIPIPVEASWTIEKCWSRLFHGFLLSKMYILPACLSVCLSICLFVCLTVGLSFHLYICVCWSACLSVCLSAYMCMSVHLSICVCLSVSRSPSLPVWLSICPTLCLPVCLSVYMSIFLSVPTLLHYFVIILARVLSLLFNYHKQCCKLIRNHLGHCYR